MKLPPLPFSLAALCLFFGLSATTAHAGQILFTLDEQNSYIDLTATAPDFGVMDQQRIDLSGTMMVDLTGSGPSSLQFISGDIDGSTAIYTLLAFTGVLSDTHFDISSSSLPVSGGTFDVPDTTVELDGGMLTLSSMTLPAAITFDFASFGDSVVMPLEGTGATISSAAPGSMVELVLPAFTLSSVEVLTVLDEGVALNISGVGTLRATGMVPVPEPSALALSLLGGLGLAAFARHRRRSV